MVKLTYVQPSLKKYGTMKEVTLGLGGSVNNSTNNSYDIGPDRRNNRADPGLDDREIS